jgi:molybdate transport system permease protein
VRRADRVASIAAGVATAVVFGFVAVPLLAIFLRVPPSVLLDQLGSKVTLDALVVSLRSTLIALVLIVAFGTPAAYILGTRRFRGSGLLTIVLELPLVLPPAVAGIALFAAFGRFGLLGGTLRFFGIQIPFTQAAVVMALAYVALPFYTRQAVATFASMDHRLLGASRTLGAGPARTFFHVALPLARQGLAAGAALAWARALGEFGATILFAGSLQGKTQTLPLAIYDEFTGGNLDGALAISAFLVVVSAGLFVGIRVLLRSRGGDWGSPSVEGSAWDRGSTSSSVTA